MIKYLNGTNETYLSLRADDLIVVKWYVDASFTVHPYFKSRNGAIITMVHGYIQ